MKSHSNSNSRFEYCPSTLDSKHNEQTTPPPDECVRIPCIWAFEVFPPAFIANLRLAAEKLNWTKNQLVPNPDFPDSVDRMRYRLSGGGWLNLGVIVRDSDSHWGMERKAELPDGVMAIHASIIQYIPSTTILVCQFLLNEEMANSLDQPFRETYSSYKERTDIGWSYHDVVHQKRKSIEATRESLRTLCTEWLKRSFPGLYASGLFGKSFPTCELITLKKHEPFSHMGEGTERSFLSMIDMDREFNAWKSEGINGLYLQHFEDDDKDLNQLVFSGRISEIFKGMDMDTLASNSMEVLYLPWMDDFDNTLGIWMLYAIARTYVKQLGIMRDSYGSLDLNAFNLTASNVRSLDDKLLNLQHNLMPFVQELVSLCRTKALILHEVHEFVPMCEHRKDELGFFDSLRKRMLMLAHSLRINEEQIRSIANRCTQIVYAISNERLANTNVRLQRRILFLTFVLIILTLILVVSEPRAQDIVANVFKYLFGLKKD